MPTVSVPAPTFQSSSLPNDPSGAVIDVPPDLCLPRLRCSEERDRIACLNHARADDTEQRVIVMLDSSSESLRSAERLFAKHPAHSTVVALRGASHGSAANLLGGDEVIWEGAKITAVGHGDAPGQVMAQMRELGSYLKAHAGEPPRQLSLLCCDAAAALDDGKGILLEAVHAVFAEADLPTRLSGYSGGLHIGEDGRRYAADAACRKLVLKSNAHGSVEHIWLNARRVDGNADFYLGKSNEKGKKNTVARKEERAKKAQAADGDCDRKTVGRFLTPVKKAIKVFSNTPTGKLIEAGLKNSDLAHRMSFEDIKRCVVSHAIDSKQVSDLINILTIPCRAYGGVAEGNREYYDFVNANIEGLEEFKAKEVLIELLNSSPYNLRPGDSAENRALGKAFDPNLDKTGNKSPLSRSIDDLGKKYPGLLSPPKEFKLGKNRRPDNVDRDATPEHRSSTSLTQEAERPFERSLLSGIGGAKMRKYSDPQPFGSLA